MPEKTLHITEITRWLTSRGEELNARLQGAIQTDLARTAAPAVGDCADDRRAITVRAESELFLIRQALGRIASGTFGRCLNCGAPISEARLSAVPYAACCNPCATSRQRQVQTL